MNYVKIGEKTVPMTANAATDALYESLFNSSAIQIQTGRDLTSGEVVELIYRVGYVMAKQAECPSWKLPKLSIKDYHKWLSQFNRSDYLAAVWYIRLVYEGWPDDQIAEYGAEYDKLNGDD